MEKSSSLIHQLRSRGTRTTACEAVDPQLPSNFKCKDSDYCISVNTGTTAICCGLAFDCLILDPRSCDVQYFNVTNNPNGNIFTTRLGDNLPTCGDHTCCPFGYTCNSDARCHMLVDQSPLSTVCEACQSPTSLHSSNTATPMASQSADALTIRVSTTTGRSSTVLGSSSSLSPTPTKPSNISSSSQSTNTLSTGAKVGIGIGAAIGAFALCATIISLMYKRRQKYTEASQQEKNYQSSDAQQSPNINVTESEHADHSPSSTWRASELHSDSRLSVPGSVELPADNTTAHPRYYRPYRGEDA